MSDGGSEVYKQLADEQIREAAIKKFISFFKDGDRDKFNGFLLEPDGKIIDDIVLEAILLRVKNNDLLSEDIVKITDALLKTGLNKEQRSLLSEYQDDSYFFSKVLLKFKN